MKRFVPLQSPRNAYLVKSLVAEGRCVSAVKYLYALRRFSMVDWLVAISQLLRMAEKPNELNTYATLIEVSKGSLLDQKAHLVPGLAADLHGRKFDYEHCLLLIKQIRSDRGF